MANLYKESGAAAFTLTGPYGSGKSSLLLNFSALLGDDATLRQYAAQSMSDDDFHGVLNGFDVTDQAGWIVVPIVGSKIPANEALKQKLQVAYGLRQSKRTEALSLLENIVADGQSRCLILFDEMGKFLEAAAEGIGDIYFFQQLAELAARSQGRVLVLGVLHQAFTEYGRNLGRTIRDEWAKVSGRFQDLPLNIAGEEVIDLIGRAITTEFKPQQVTSLSLGIAEHIAMNRPISDKELLAQSLTNCWPLHPIVAALLGPISRRRFGQNQRSVFGFLNSTEPRSLRNFLGFKELHADEIANYEADVLYLPQFLWDYLQTNLEPAILASPDGHRWSLAVDAVTRTIGYTDDETLVNIVKCIALLDLFSERSGLVPVNDVLEMCLLDSGGDIEQNLQQLSDWSILRYRIYRRAYSLWEGSDFDIDSAIKDAEDYVPQLSAFDRIRGTTNFQPIVAKQHYHKTGAIRWMDVEIVPVEHVSDVVTSFHPTNGSIGLYMIVVGDDGQPDSQIEQICRSISEASDIFPIITSVARHSPQIRMNARELQSLEWIRETNPALGGDTVARREVEARISMARNDLHQNLSENLYNPTWYADGTEYPNMTPQGLHRLTSTKADYIFFQGPRIMSELANRDRPSSNANGAIKALLKAMVEHQDEERLGIVGYPPEGGLFDVLLEGTLLYDTTRGVGLSLSLPRADQDASQLIPMWKAVDDYCHEHNHSPVTLNDVYNIWKEPPFGIKTGLLPFFALAYMITRAHTTAVYLDNIYRPILDDLFVDVLMKSPQDISMRQIEFDDINEQILRGIVDTLNASRLNEPLLFPSSPLLQIARHLVSRVSIKSEQNPSGLDPWVLRTQELTTDTKRLREAIKNANDPNKLLFDDLPILYREHAGSLEKGDVSPIVASIQNGLMELSDAYHQLLANMERILMISLGVDHQGQLGYNEINQRSLNVPLRSGDYSLDNFIRLLRTYQGGNAGNEDLLVGIIGKHSSQWIDLDMQRAEREIAALAQQFMHQEAFSYVDQREGNRQGVAFVVGDASSGTKTTIRRNFTVKGIHKDHVDGLEKALASAMEGYAARITDLHPDVQHELQLNALANIGKDLIESLPEETLDYQPDGENSNLDEREG